MLTEGQKFEKIFHSFFQNYLVPSKTKWGIFFQICLAISEYLNFIDQVHLKLSSLEVASYCNLNEYLRDHKKTEFIQGLCLVEVFGKFFAYLSLLYICIHPHTKNPLFLDQSTISMYIHTTCTDVPCRKQTQIEFYRVSDIQKASEPDNFGFYMIEILTFDRLIWYVLRSGDFLFPFCFYMRKF